MPQFTSRQSRPSRMRRRLMKIRLVLLLTSLAVALLGSPAFPAQESVPAPPLPPAAPVLVPPPPGPVPPPPPVSAEMLDRHTLRVSPVERTAPGQYRIGEILVNAAEKSITFPAEISMERGCSSTCWCVPGGRPTKACCVPASNPITCRWPACWSASWAPTSPSASRGTPQRPRRPGRDQPAPGTAKTAV